MKLFATTPMRFLTVKNGHIAYAPKRNIAFTVNDRMYHLLCEIIKGHDVTLQHKNDICAIDRLKSSQLISDAPEDSLKSNTQRSQHFRALVLLLTRKCNLSCGYCFADGGHSDSTMPVSLARKSVILMANHLKECNKKEFHLSIHGGGEPTTAWATLKNIYDYTKSICIAKNLKLHTRLTSNGIWSRNQAEWISINIDQISISLDGPEDICAIQRPMSSGENPWPILQKSLEVLRNHEKPIRLRSTVTQHNVMRLTGIVECFDGLGARRVQFEPLVLSGKGARGVFKRPDPDVFCDNLVRAIDRGYELGVDVYCSYYRPLWKGSAYCSANGYALNVSPEGILSTCHRISCTTDPGASNFIIGSYDTNQSRFLIDKERVDEMRKTMGVNDIYCNNCIAKYNCLGGCYAQNFAASNNYLIPDPFRCKITRMLFKYFLSKAVSF